MELLLDLGKCNRCTLAELREGAGNDGLILTTEDWHGGTVVRIEGQRICWMKRIPTECQCPKDAEEGDPRKDFKAALERVADHFEEHVRDLQEQIDHLKGRYAAHVREDSH